MTQQGLGVTPTEAVMIVVLWTTVFTVLDVLAPALLSTVVVSGFAGGVSLVLSFLYLHEPDQ